VRDLKGATGCTVVLCRAAGGRRVSTCGGAPGTRETDCLAPANLVERVHAVMLAGGSAFGLDAATGVMRYLNEQGIASTPGWRGFRLCRQPSYSTWSAALPRPTRTLPWATRPASTPAEARAPGQRRRGAGATVGKAAGRDFAMKARLARPAPRRQGGLIVGGVWWVNCLGDVPGHGDREMLVRTLTL